MMFSHIGTLYEYQNDTEIYTFCKKVLYYNFKWQIQIMKF